ncbi:hypothetical protein [Bacillus taeanensis]|uniref:Uncharacterized protein n=1 Tax=Bacillus taeanensis TaxID=273032 RepID=A0A366XVX8_9BACI|nr:hypothetical protein [Bacillus taeanensis]RBW69796.1 hypothetical protein DS031_09700 [Bacillus taeanensis]
MFKNECIHHFNHKAENRIKRKEYASGCQLGKRSRKAGMILKDLGVEMKTIESEVMGGGVKLFDS